MHNFHVARGGPPRHRGAATLAAGCLAASAALGQGPADAARPAGEAAFFEELPVILSVSRLPQPVTEVPGAVTVIDRDLLRATGYRDLARIFRLVPGFNVVQERGSQSFVAYHGLADNFPNRMQVLVDGRSVYSPFFLGGADWEGMPLTLEEIDRIEILRGSNSALYGSNAFLGVANIITRHSAQEPGVTVGAAAGERGVGDGFAWMAAGSGALSYRLSTSYQRDEGFAELFDSTRRAVATTRFDYRPGGRSEVTLSAGGNRSHRGMGFEDTAFNQNGTRDLATTQSFLHLRWRYAPTAEEEWSAGYYRNHERGREEWTAFQVVPVDFNRSAVRDNVDFQHRFSPSAATRLVWGAELRRDHLESARLFFGRGSAESELTRGFGSLEWRLADGLIANGAGMLEHYEGKPSRFSPRLFLNWQAAPRHTLRAGVTRAYREPALFEEQGDTWFFPPAGVPLPPRNTFGSAGRLDPERLLSREVGYVGRFAASTALDVRIFNDEVRDLIRSVGTDRPELRCGASQAEAVFCNIPGTVKISGIEYQLRTSPRPGTDLLLSHAVQRTRSEEADLEHIAPPYTASLTWLQRYPRGWSSTLSVLRVGPMEWGGSAAVPSYTAADGRVAQRFTIGRTGAEASLGFINAGRRHEEFRTIPDRPNPVGRYGYVSLRLDL